MAFWYGVIPIAGAFYNRHIWYLFKNRFNKLRLLPLLDYRQYRQIENDAKEKTTELYQFTGGVESITDGHTLWVKGSDLTISVSLEPLPNRKSEGFSQIKTKCFLLSKHEGTDIPDSLEQISWDRISTLTEGAKVFIGGQIKSVNNRLIFCSTKEEPLMVIFYNCPYSELPGKIISAARPQNEYWNGLTPISLVIGALALIYIASSLLGRPAFRLTVIAALVAVFVPILHFFPPGFILTALYRRLSWNAGRLRAQWDIARFGLKQGVTQKQINLYWIKAYTTELFAWAVLLLGISINIFFIYLILYLLQVISFN